MSWCCVQSARCHGRAPGFEPGYQHLWTARTRGLDIHATSFIREQICRARDLGLAVLWISEDLDELLMVSDRIAVIFDGRIVGILTKEEASINLLGQMMTGMENINSSDSAKNFDYA